MNRVPYMKAKINDEIKPVSNSEPCPVNELPTGFRPFITYRGKRSDVKFSCRFVSAQEETAEDESSEEEQEESNENNTTKEHDKEEENQPKRKRIAPQNQKTQKRKK